MDALWQLDEQSHSNDDRNIPTRRRPFNSHDIVVIVLPSSSFAIRAVTRGQRTRSDGDHQDHDGKLHFSADCWTSPNHRAYIAVVVHFENEGIPIALLLDVVEVAKVCGLRSFANAPKHVVDTQRAQPGDSVL